MKIELSKYENTNSCKLRRLAWEVVWAVLFRPTPRWCLNGWRCMLLRLFGARIGRGVRINGGARIWQPWRLAIGDYSWIDGGVSLYSVAEITIGANVVISEGAYVCTASHDIASETFDLVSKLITIGNGAWIAARAIVLPGVTIGEGAVVGAGAVVSKDIAPCSVVAGNPAKLVKNRP